MKAMLLALSVFLSLAAKAEWFTITGTPGSPASDYFQFDVGSLRHDGSLRFIDIRASRLAPQVTSEGITYRSFEATAVVDCEPRHGTLHSQHLLREAELQRVAGQREAVLGRCRPPSSFAGRIQSGSR